MTLCGKENCVWRNDLGDGVYYCFRQNCPNAIEVAKLDRVLKVKWLGLTNYKNWSYKKYCNNRGETDE